jgi:hypothetical protein
MILLIAIEYKTYSQDSAPTSEILDSLSDSQEDGQERILTETDGKGRCDNRGSQAEEARATGRLKIHMLY